jgi:N-acetylmuramate 1-kinase
MNPTALSLPAAISFTSLERKVAFSSWLAALPTAYGLQTHSLVYASADAGFRRYFRIQGATQSFIVMDAPPELENCEPFVRIAALLRDAGLTVPQVLAWDEAQGFMLLNDLGQRTLLQAIEATDKTDAPNVLAWYHEAVRLLVALQAASKPDVLPAYDHALLRREVTLYPDWYVAKHRQYTTTSEQQSVWLNTTELIIRHNLAQPQVYVHRDYMPRNLMVGEQHAKLAVLDFQDAVHGPITYDIASLMRDAFLTWPEDFVIDITVRYWEAARAAHLPVNTDFGEFYKAVEWMSLQRHLKILGIFARLNYRDHKPKYLSDTPRFIDYVRHTTKRYVELAPLYRLINQVEASVDK